MSTQSDAYATELLRLARKIWPDCGWELWSDGRVHMASNPYTAAAAVMYPPGWADRERRDLSRRAELAALRVMAGEAAPLPRLDVTEFIRLCTRLRDTDGSDEASLQAEALEWLDQVVDAGLLRRLKGAKRDG